MRESIFIQFTFATNIRKLWIGVKRLFEGSDSQPQIVKSILSIGDSAR